MKGERGNSDIKGKGVVQPRTLLAPVGDPCSSIFVLYSLHRGHLGEKAKNQSNVTLLSIWGG
jgi:hypothetical protein